MAPTPKRRKRTPEEQQRLDEFACQDVERGRGIARRAVEIGPDKGGVDMINDSLFVTTDNRKYGMFHELLMMACKGIDTP
ncbi:MAG: hypothetical protein PHV02_16020 [Rhodocyclaceae bacterium]|nr:hypothetical protein [Rhodocyclaceae bacterium]